MLVTRETDYAIRALRALSDGQKKTLADICKVEIIPQQFGYKILKKLSNVGCVTIKRGKEGGYIIAKDFKNWTLYDITVAMENPMDISPCIVPGYQCEVHGEIDESCTVRTKLCALQEALDTELKKVNLQELFDEQRAIDRERMGANGEERRFYERRSSDRRGAGRRSIDN